MTTEKSDILSISRKWLTIVVIVAFIFEIIFFPSVANILGGFMAIISWMIYYNFFLKRIIILQYPFAFLMYSSMFLYRFLPLIATVIEFKPITYGFQKPIETFFYEILLFFISSLAFYWACPLRYYQKNNFLQKLLMKNKFFEITPNILWGMGLIGFAIRLYTFNLGSIETGNVLGKFLMGLNYLMYAPIILLFPSLLNLFRVKYKLSVLLYIAAITVINVASNSRQAIITPIIIFVLLFFINAVRNKVNVNQILSPVKMLFIVLFVLFGLNFFSDMSLAMLYTRSVRSEITKTELLKETLTVFKDENQMNSLRSIANSESSEINSYELGWDETYISNFMLNRYANMRISDQTLYYAKKKGFNNREMQNYFFKSILALMPSPILKVLDIHIDKDDIAFSTGDLLYGESLGSRKVSSHVGSGLATFGYWYFPIQFILFFFVFKLLNTFVFYTPFGIRYAPYALMNVFVFLGMFRNASGCLLDLSYILRGYIQGIFTFFIVYLFIKFVLQIQNKRPNIYLIHKQ